MGNKKSLRYLISKYAIIELVYTLFIIGLFYVGLNVLLNAGVVYPANYADIQTGKVETGFQTEDWTPAEIPYYYDFLYLKDGKIIENTIDKKYDDLVQQAIKNGRAISSEIIGSNIFKAYTRGNRQLVIRYRVNVIFTNEKLYRLFENFECGYIVLILIIWFLGFALFLIRSSNILKREIHKIAMANDNISRMDLDYEREYSKYKEIDGVLVSIDVLAENLKKSLGEQWDMQVKQKELVEQLTHDIRTPITLIKGNLELLKEEHSDLSSERFADISNGIDRLEKYIDKLKKFSYTMEGKKDVVSNEVILYWIEIMSGICRLNGLNLEVIKSECSNIMLDKEEVAAALQNIVANAVEYSKKGSKITVEFKDEPEEFILTVRDEGTGFNKDLLPLLTEKFISGKVKDKSNKHGLGLWVVKNIVVANKGNLYLKNYTGVNAGAEVKMVFNKRLKNNYG
ncbi:sensor histidine kinase [Lachnoanaerobaculum umeaense]|uniref:histidine kinase n=1 Tax=Lachnoanaerobaculum umeaense TaxID=617123 RepID=A0A385Q1H5_9FIRM|nr:HAMP domain-containing sensor histidine kinase [Lachnoanaerobaculum umeaense]AYB00173.1 sensor histidine kinase [Lachnoanaerobaculum umeaense]PZW94669.1 signal transduction histidine kinase [Lachnoanaerobaculum umeaense]